MPPQNPRLRILSVGGNAVSAFLSWRLSATNACDVTLVWKSGFESVSQYGISFKSALFGNERFKPRAVVRTPEEAANISKGAYDYVLLCVKALPDVYDLAAVIEPVVTSQHTCILINTSTSLGIERLIEERFPKNVVLSLVSAVEINQLGPAEFEHKGPSDLWVGPATQNPDIPASIQSDMSQALAMTLASGQVECKVSANIQQQQFERMAGPITFNTSSVLFEEPNHAELLEVTGVRDLISDAIDEIVKIAEARRCVFHSGFKEKIMEEMIIPKEANSIMYQDYAAKRPMEIETYLGSPLKLAKQSGVKAPRLETLYAMLHHVNIANQNRASMVPNEPPTPNSIPATRMLPPNPSRVTSMNGHMGGYPPQMRGRGGRAPSMTGPPPPMRRAASGMNGYGPQPIPMGGPPPRGYGQMQRRPSFESNGLDEFSHLVVYDNPPDFGENGHGSADMALREREFMLRQKELALRERELHMRPGPGPRGRTAPAMSHAGGFDDDDDDGDDYFDPMAYRGPPVDPDNVDMMSITSRRTRKQPSSGQLRQDPQVGQMGGLPAQRRSNMFGRPGPQRNRTSSRIMDIPSAHDNLMDNPMLGYSSDRYGGLDRSVIGREGRESRSGSLTASRLSELGGGNGASYGGYPTMGNPQAARRASQSPGNPLVPGGGPMPGGPSMGGPMPSRPSPPGYVSNGRATNGRVPPSEVRQPTPRHPPGHGNSVAPQQVEQHAGVSNLYPPKNGPQVRSLTGSASASAGSGDSGRIDSENSGYSSQSSFGPRPTVGVR